MLFNSQLSSSHHHPLNGNIHDLLLNSSHSQRLYPTRIRKDSISIPPHRLTLSGNSYSRGHHRHTFYRPLGNTGLCLSSVSSPPIVSSSVTAQSFQHDMQLIPLSVRFPLAPTLSLTKISLTLVGPLPNPRSGNAHQTW
jgi:hypothetical protein